MLKVIQDSTLSAIGDALRSKTLSVETYLPSEMGSSVANYTVGFDEIARKVPVYAHGTTSEILPSAFIGISHMITGVDFSNCETVGAYAFSNCQMISEVSLPTCRSISEGAFYFCCSISTLSLPECEFVANKAFGSCSSMTELYAPNITVMGTETDTGGNGPFQSCINLETAYVPNLTNALDRAFCDCSKLSEVNLSKCVKIGAYALNNTAITSISIPVCTTLSNSAFRNCKLVPEVDLPVCTYIGASAFLGCLSLSRVSAPVCATLGQHAFFGCSKLSEASFPECVTVGSSAFRIIENTTSFFSSLTAARFPKCTTLNQCAFVCQAGMSVAEFPLLKSVQFATFWGCSGLTSIDFPECTSIAAHGSYGVFERCAALETVVMEKCKYIGDRAFTSCYALASLSFPQCSYVANHAFLSCRSLSSVYLPSCRSLYGSVFLGCTSLETLSLPALEYFRGYYTISGTKVSTLSLPMLKAVQEQHAMRSCTTLQSLFLLGPLVATMANTNDLMNTPMSVSTYTGSFGSIYVPEWLYNSYTKAANWSAYSARFASVSLQSYASIVDVFHGNISAHHVNGVEITSSSVDDAVAEMQVREWSAGHEGFQVKLIGFEVGKVYRLSFDLQFLDTTFLSNYCVGFKVEQYAVTAYDTYANWPNNITRDLNEHHYSWVFEPSKETMYLSFELDGLTDRSNNTLKIWNLMVEEVRWDLANL